MNPEEIIRKMWSSNAFMNVLKIEIKEVHCGGATLVMPIDFDIHTNHWLGVHGGAMAALADCVTGITCASVGKICTTLNMNIDYISNVRGLGALSVTSRIVHKGQSTINIVSEIKDDAGNLICNVTYIMFVMDKLQEVPENGNKIKNCPDVAMIDIISCFRAVLLLCLSLSVLVSVFLLGVLLAIVCLHLIYLIDIQSTQGNSDNQT